MVSLPARRAWVSKLGWEIELRVKANITDKWQSAFLGTVQRPESASLLKEAALSGRLADWTGLLTSVVVMSFREMGWQASARGNKLTLLPIARSEYLSLDVVAFPDAEKRWRFPIAVAELENSRDDDHVAYSLWKLMCVQADLRILICYRADASAGSELIQFLRDEVVHSMELSKRMQFAGDIIVVVGRKGDEEAFPYGYFKWWVLDLNTSTFRLM
jgi:hypothetical protein